MTPTKETIKSFFQGDKQYTIPVYQRAYSWEREHWEVFLEDLNEAKNGKNSYFFGNVLLEKDGEKSDLIDGQQRLTTIVIFMRSLHDVLKAKKFQDENFLHYLNEDYLVNRGKEKLRSIGYDEDYFRDLIIRGEEKHDPQTPSQERIVGAKDFFVRELKKRETDELIKFFEVIERAEILSIKFENKKDSVLMFELQNNRGKELTNLEKLKSYLAYQIYIYAQDNVEDQLHQMTKVFEEIYRLLKDITKTKEFKKEFNFDEDQILNWFNFSEFGFEYRENEASKNYKAEFKKIVSEKKIEWIGDYIKRLKDAFVDFKEFLSLDNQYKDWLLSLNVSEIYPLILKAYSLFRNDKGSLEECFNILEVIAFRHRLVKTGADLASRLNRVLKTFKSVEDLREGIKSIFSEKEYYWSDQNIERVICSLKGNKFLPYLMMHYENHLRGESARSKGYRFSLKDIQDPEIEHIAPQTEGGEILANGYCEYDDEFYREYLHCVGNLVLISKPHNISNGNNPLADKLKDFNISALSQQREIKDFVNQGIWDKDSIDERHEKLRKFILETWSLE